MRRPRALLAVLALAACPAAQAEYECPSDNLAEGESFDSVAIQCHSALTAISRDLAKVTELKETDPGAAQRMAAETAAHFSALQPRLAELNNYIRRHPDDTLVQGLGEQFGFSQANQKISDRLRPFMPTDVKPDEKIDFSMGERDLNKQPAPETPPGPLPTPAGREDAARRAQRGEDQLGRQPSPDPAQSSRVAKDYLRGNQPDGASRVLDRLIESGGGAAEAYRLRAAARFQQRDWAGAYSDARRALDRDPNDTVAADLMGTARMQLSRLGLEPPRLKPGADRPRDAQGAAEGGGDGPRWSGSGTVTPPSGGPAALDSRGAVWAAIERRIHIGDRREALLALTRYLDRYPDDARAWAKRASLLNRSKDPAAALLDAEKALALAPDDPVALRERAYALLQLGRPQEALQSVQRAILLQPGNALGYLYRAMALSALGRTEAALQDYARAARLDASLRGYYEEALAGASAGAKGVSDAGPLSRGRLRALVALVAAPLLLFGLWGGLRRLWTTREREPAPEPPAPQGSAETLTAGGLLGGLYRIGRVLGRGGMGVVFEAEDLGLERRVAVKQLRAPEGAAEDQQRFLREARLVAQLSHPNIVSIYTLVEDNGLLYLVFELVQGRGLDAVLDEKGRFSAEEAHEVLRGVCAALDCAHGARIIHRDLKPSNVMRTDKGAYKVMDFGIAHQARGAAPLTQTAAWGTPPYMAPEQERGLVSKESDLYALGCTLYELLTGQRPFGAGSDKLTPRFTPLRDLAPGLPPGFDAFMDRALAPDPARRFHSGAELLAAYEACLAGRVSA